MRHDIGCHIVWCCNAVIPCLECRQSVVLRLSLFGVWRSIADVRVSVFELDLRMVCSRLYLPLPRGLGGKYRSEQWLLLSSCAESLALSDILSSSFSIKNLSIWAGPMLTTRRCCLTSDSTCCVGCLNMISPSVCGVKYHGIWWTTAFDWFVTDIWWRDDARLFNVADWLS